jgi:hypothetical protein
MWIDDLERLRKLQATRLKEARELRGFSSASAAARRYNWNVASYVSHENGTRGIGRMYREYARKLRVSPAWLLGHSDDRDSVVRGVIVVGDASVGTWRDRSSGGSSAGSTKTVGVPTDSEYDDDDKFAVRVADASMSKVLPQNSFAICVPVPEGARLRIEQIVYVERTRDGLVEMSLRRVSAVTANGKATLSTHPTDARQRQDISFPSTRSEERLRIVGNMVGKYEDYPHS